MIELKFTKEEIAALAGLLDAGVRATGLRAVKDASGLLVKIDAAMRDLPDDADVIED